MECLERQTQRGLPLSLSLLNRYIIQSWLRRIKLAFFASSFSQLTSVPCFSGRSKRTFNDAFFDHLVEDKRHSQGGRSLQNLIGTYTTLRDEMREHLERQNRTLTMGTTGWKRIEDVTATLEGSDVEDMVVNSTGKFFLGKS